MYMYVPRPLLSVIRGTLILVQILLLVLVSALTCKLNYLMNLHCVDFEIFFCDLDLIFPGTDEYSVNRLTLATCRLQQHAYVIDFIANII